jgi:uncharacterized protein
MENRVTTELLKSRTIAMVGLSKDPAKPSQVVAAFLQAHGYRIVPVNPTAEEILGEKCFLSVLDVPDELARTIEVVDVFRKSGDVPAIVDEAITLKKKFGALKGIWLQSGIWNDGARLKAEGAGLLFVQDQCMKIELGRLDRLQVKK